MQKHTETVLIDWHLAQQTPLGLISRSVAGNTHSLHQLAKFAVMFSHFISKSLSFL